MTVPTDKQQSPPRPRALFWRLIALILIVIVVLGITNLAIIGIRALDRPDRPAPKVLLYASTFDAYNQEWDQFEGQMSAKIASSSLTIKVDTPQDGTYSVLNHDFSDFDIRVNTRRITANDPYNEIWLMFRYRDKDNFYTFKIVADGSYCVERRQGGKTEILSACHPSPAVFSGLTLVNQMRVVGVSDHFWFYVNDQPLLLCPKGSDKFSTWNGDKCLSNNKQTSYELIDPGLDYGKIGLGVRVRTPGIQVTFNNLLVYGP